MFKSGLLSYEIFSCAFFHHFPFWILYACFVKILFEIPIESTHFIYGVHSMVTGTDLSNKSRAHKLEKDTTSTSISSAFVVYIRLGYYFVATLFYGSISFDVCIDLSIDVFLVSLYSSKVPICIIDSHDSRCDESCMTQ